MHVGMYQPNPTPATRPAQGGSRHLAMAAVLSAIVLAGCASKSPAPVSDMSRGGGPTAETYVVRPGDTLYKIAQANNTDVSTLIRLNGISNPSQLNVGQTLRLKGEPGQPLPTTPQATPLPVEPVAPVSPAAPVRASDANVISWGWPATGTVIQSFNTNTKGIDIAGAVGDPVVAAASGKVMYAGNGVRGLGNLILLGHSNGFITAYAHNQSLLVKTGQQVDKGSKIATIGQTDTSSPRLHFEIRRSGTPVNPMSYLPPTR